MKMTIPNCLFTTGTSEYHTNMVVDVPVKICIRNEKGEDDILVMVLPTYAMQGAMPFLLGLNQMKKWQSKNDTFT